MILEYKDFVKQAKDFIQLSDKIRDGWKLAEQDGVQFITKRSTFTTHQGSPVDTWSCDYHVIHNVSYQVPTLYFTIHTDRGELVSLDKIWSEMMDHQPLGQKWELVTQTEHPLLSLPYYHIHPCHTADLMSLINRDKPSKNYLVSWLTSFATFNIGLAIPLDYAVLV